MNLDMEGDFLTCLFKSSVIDQCFELLYSILSAFLPLSLSIISIFITAKVRFKVWREKAEQKKCNYVRLGTPEPFKERVHLLHSYHYFIQIHPFREKSKRRSDPFWLTSVWNKVQMSIWGCAEVFYLPTLLEIYRM